MMFVFRCIGTTGSSVLVIFMNYAIYTTKAQFCSYMCNAGSFLFVYSLKCCDIFSRLVDLTKICFICEICVLSQ